jgi:hypothetical protein
MTVANHIQITQSTFGCEWLEGRPEFQSKAVGDLAAHWMELFINGGGVPYRREIDPVIIGGALSQVFIYERVDTGFVCCLAGEGLSWNYKDRLKGRRLSGILEPSIHEMVNLFMDICLEEPAVYRNFGLLYSDSQKRQNVGERVFLPLRDNDRSTVFIIGLTDVTTLRDAPLRPSRAFYRCGQLLSPAPVKNGSVSSGRAGFGNTG